MQQDGNSLATLIGSRICHDLISPIGAVNNGLELLEMSGASDSPELALVAESVASANARIRFFRLAFGVASKDQMTGADEVNTILSGVYTEARTQISAFPDGSFPRSHVRAVLLALMCVEQAIPYGGSLHMDHQAPVWRIWSESDRLVPDPALWRLLWGGTSETTPPPAAVQFLMLPELLPEMNLRCTAETTENKAEITIEPV
ncbi:MAG: histidine phosphotransferase family protein [Pseudomonadota bacterium]